MGAGAPAHGSRCDHRARSFAGVVVTAFAGRWSATALGVLARASNVTSPTKPIRRDAERCAAERGAVNLACGNNKGACAFIPLCAAAWCGPSFLPYCLVIDNAPKRAVISMVDRR